MLRKLSLLMLSILWSQIASVYASDLRVKSQKEFEKGNYATVLSLLKNSDDKDSLILKGRAHEITDPGIGDELLKAAQLFPDDAYALAWGGDAYARRRNTSAAFYLLRQAVRRKKSDGEISAIFGHFLFKYGNKASGMQLMKSAIAAQPDLVVAREFLAESYRENYEVSEALSQFNEIVKAHPQMPYPLYLRARLYEQMGRRKDAQCDYELSLKLNPTFKLGLAYNARLTNRLGQFEKSIELSNLCLQTDDNDSISRLARLTRADSFTKLKKYNLAMADLNHLIERIFAVPRKPFEGHDKELLLLRANLFFETKQPKLALQDLQTIELEGKNRSSAISLLKARAFEDLGQNQSALNEYNWLISRGMPTAEFYRNRARILLKMGFSKASQADLDASRKLLD